MTETLLTFQRPAAGNFSLFKNTWNGQSVFETLTIVSGLCGNQSTDFYVGVQLSRFMNRIMNAEEPSYRLRGRVNLLPAVNVQAMESGSRFWDFDGMDLNLAFPGSSAGEVTERICNETLRQTADSNCCVILSPAPIHYECIPHILLFDPTRSLKKIASASGFALGKIGAEHDSHRTHLTRYLSERGVPAFTVVAGTPGRFDRQTGNLIFSSLVNIMLKMNILESVDKKSPDRKMRFCASKEESQIVSGEAGLFVPETSTGDNIKEKGLIGRVYDVRTGHTLDEVVSPVGGMITFLKNHPLVHEKETLAVVLEEKTKSLLWPF